MEPGSFLQLLHQSAVAYYALFFVFFTLVSIPVMMLVPRGYKFEAAVGLSVFFVFTATDVLNLAFFLLFALVLIGARARGMRGWRAAALIVLLLLFYPLLSLGPGQGLVFYPIMLSLLAVASFRGWIMVRSGKKAPDQALAYMTYFPMALLGPIQRIDDFEPRSLSKPGVLEGGKRLALGLLALFLALYLFDHGISWGGAHIPAIYPPLCQGYVSQGVFSLYFPPFLYLNAFKFFLYLYGFFAFIRGSSLLMGFELADNFPEFPYAKSRIKDFWRTWNATVMSFLRDYVYIPLGGRRHRYRNVVLVFLLSGIWHVYIYTYSGSGYRPAWFFAWALTAALSFIILERAGALLGSRVGRWIMPFLITTATGFAWVIFGFPLRL